MGWDGGMGWWVGWWDGMVDGMRDRGGVEESWRRDRVRSSAECGVRNVGCGMWEVLAFGTSLHLIAASSSAPAAYHCKKAPRRERGSDFGDSHLFDAGSHWWRAGSERWRA